MCKKTVCLTCFDKAEFEGKYDMTCPYCHQVNGDVMTCKDVPYILPQYAAARAMEKAVQDAANRVKREPDAPDSEERAKRAKREPGDGGPGQ